MSSPTLASSPLPTDGRPTPPLGATLRAIEPFLPRELVGGEAFQRVAATCAALPAVVTKWIYFECRLHSDSNSVDIVFDIDRAGRPVLAGESGAVDPPAALRRAPAWNRIVTYCREWGSPGGSFSDVVDHLWLEFDDPGEDPPGYGTAVPGVFVCFGEIEPLPGFIERRSTCVRDTIGRLAGDTLSRDAARLLERCVERLPAGAHTPYVGVMLQRTGSVVRLCAYGLGEARLLDYLSDIAWPGPASEIESLVAGIRRAHMDSSYHGIGLVHVDLTDGVHPRLGVEYTLGRKPQLAGRLANQELLDHLVRLGLCSTAKRNALAAWPGASIVTLPHELWRTVMVRRVNHLKLVYEPGRGISAKAYLCAGFGARNARGAVAFRRPDPDGRSLHEEEQ